jgi:hypothetical protein
VSSKADTPRRGDFGWQALVSAFEPTLDDMMSNRAYFGMPPEALYLWGTFRDQDGEIYTPGGEIYKTKDAPVQEY